QHALDAHVGEGVKTHFTASAVEEAGVAIAVKARCGYEHVRQAVTVDVEKVTERFVYGVVGASGERQRSAIEGHVAAQMIRVRLTIGGIALDLTVVEGHRRKAPAACGRRQHAALLTRRNRVL